MSKIKQPPTADAVGGCSILKIRIRGNFTTT